MSAGHAAHTAAPGASAAVPAGHGSHAVRPGPPAYAPAGHGTQGPSTPGRPSGAGPVVPGGHGARAVTRTVASPPAAAAATA